MKVDHLHNFEHNKIKFQINFCYQKSKNTQSIWISNLSLKIFSRFLLATSLKSWFERAPWQKLSRGAQNFFFFIITVLFKFQFLMFLHQNPNFRSNWFIFVNTDLVTLQGLENLLHTALKWIKHISNHVWSEVCPTAWSDNGMSSKPTLFKSSIIYSHWK